MEYALKHKSIYNNRTEIGEENVHLIISNFVLNSETTLHGT